MLLIEKPAATNAYMSEALGLSEGISPDGASCGLAGSCSANRPDLKRAVSSQTGAKGVREGGELVGAVESYSSSPLMCGR